MKPQRYIVLGRATLKNPPKVGDILLRPISMSDPEDVVQGTVLEVDERGDVTVQFEDGRKLRGSYSRYVDNVTGVPGEAWVWAGWRD